MAYKGCRWQDTPVGQALLESVNLNPDDPASRETLEATLEKRAASFTLPQYAMTLIACPWTYPARFTLAAGDVDTERSKIAFEEAVILVGFAIDITTDRFGVTGPELKELDIRIDARYKREFWTARAGTKATQIPDGFAPCSQIDFRAPRYFFRILETSDAEVGVQFKSRYPTGFTDNLIIDGSALALPLDWR